MLLESQLKQTKIMDFLLIVYFWDSVSFFYSVSMCSKSWKIEMMSFMDDPQFLNFEIIFFFLQCRQPQDDPFEDTLIFVESLIYSDGSKNDTFDHKWHVHNNIPGRDFFNWTGRCLSAGGHFNPYKIDLEPRAYR